ncbi:hypothetical protein CKF54_00985 [Psittacicella hinzii]|uniref:Calcineurin-like phosphoesterase domain-containing protein n=1 Tax=Psittacicella hinzii TaxID=2028575 RepID=A0A3A1YAB9_9GAMM|nr:metallophosphoesterase [Psittacicella hinzii]RIY34286.1 hypothetical protein CKF54_00985 [Psittacicella hinzii]
MAKYLIGDVHGCAREMHQLLAEVDFNPSKDELYFIGDLGCRGENSLEVLRYAEQNASGIVLGNNDLRIICLVHQGLPVLANDNLQDLLSLPTSKQHFYTDWLVRQPLIINNDAFTLVHASLDPSWSPAQMQAYNQQAMAYMQSLNHEQRGYYLGFKYFAHTLADLGQAVAQGKPLTGSWASDQELRFFAEFMLTTTVARHRQVVDAQTSSILAPQGAQQLAHQLKALGQRAQSYLIADFAQAYVDFNMQLVHEPVFAPEDGIFPWYQYQEIIPDAPSFSTPVYFGHWQQAYYAGTPNNIICTDTGCVEGKSLSIFALPEYAGQQVSPQPLVQVSKKEKL